MLKSAVNHSNTQIGVAEAEQLGLTWLITLIYDGIDLFSRPTSVYGVNKHLKLCTISQSNRPCQDVSIYAYFGAFCCELRRSELEGGGGAMSCQTSDGSI